MQQRPPRQKFEFESLALSKSAPQPQYEQLEQQLRSAIADGRLQPGTRLPSTRALAKLIGVARNTVLTAYQQLISEGYLHSRSGSGTSVSTLLPETFEFHGATSATASDPVAHLSKGGQDLARLSSWLPDSSTVAQPFRPHLAAVDEFPIDVWNRITTEQMRWSNRQLNHCDPQGYRPLRESIADYMRISRGVACTADQIVVTSGAQQGIAIIRQLLLDSGDTVWTEEPGNVPATEVFRSTQCRVVPVPVDAEGVTVPEGSAPSDHPRLICVTPASQWPLGMTMTLNRRLKLITAAQQMDSWIVEDDYNGEYRYTGRPLPTLFSLDTSGRTIYMGTFSKLLFPAIRLGFLVVPSSLGRVFAFTRWLSDRHSPPLPQMVLHRFIESGGFLKHIRQMRALYRERQRRLHDLLRQNFGTDIETCLPESGMHLVVLGRTKTIEQRLQKSAATAGVEFHTVQMYAAPTTDARGLILGFAAFDADATQQAVEAWTDAYHG